MYYSAISNSQIALRLDICFSFNQRTTFLLYEDIETSRVDVSLLFSSVLETVAYIQFGGSLSSLLIVRNPTNPTTYEQLPLPVSTNQPPSSCYILAITWNTQYVIQYSLSTPLKIVGDFQRVSIVARAPTHTWLVEAAPDLLSSLTTIHRNSVTSLSDIQPSASPVDILGLCTKINLSPCPYVAQALAVAKCRTTLGTDNLLNTLNILETINGKTAILNLDSIDTFAVGVALSENYITISFGVPLGAESIYASLGILYDSMQSSDYTLPVTTMFSELSAQSCLTSAGCYLPYTTTTTYIANSKLFLRTPHSLGALLPNDLDRLLNAILQPTLLTKDSVRSLITSLWVPTAPPSAAIESLTQYYFNQVSLFNLALNDIVNGIPILISDVLSFSGTSICQGPNALETVHAQETKRGVIHFCIPSYLHSITNGALLPSATNIDANYYHLLIHELTHLLLNTLDLDVYGNQKCKDRAQTIYAIYLSDHASDSLFEPIADCLALLYSNKLAESLAPRHVFAENVKDPSLTYMENNIMKQNYQANITCTLNMTTVPLLTATYQAHNSLNTTVKISSLATQLLPFPFGIFKVVGPSTFFCGKHNQPLRSEETFINPHSSTEPVHVILADICNFAMNNLIPGDYILQYSHLHHLHLDGEGECPVTSCCDSGCGFVNLECHTTFHIPNLPHGLGHQLHTSGQDLYPDL
jgi:hypothetical protein